MQLKSLTARQIIATVEFTDAELDMLSLALSKATLNLETPEEKVAGETLVRLSTMINELLDRMRHDDGCNK